MQYQLAGAEYGQQLIATSMRVRKAMSNRAAFAAIASAKNMIQKEKHAQQEQFFKQQQQQVGGSQLSLPMVPVHILAKRSRDDDDDDMF